MASPIDTASISLSLSLSPLLSFFTPVRLHILSTPYTEISPAQCSFNHLTLHSFMQFRKAFRVQVKGKNFQNTKVKQSKQATTDIKYSAESSLHFVIILSLKPKCDQTRMRYFLSASGIASIRLIMTKFKNHTNG